MPAEQFKTQVLLLHSDQSALDKMSAGFDDQYTVHCATSGFDALNTLGETPIHVIVSANSLPGMSGAEALREAKKRSPETVGILLTGDEDPEVEALVGDSEIFQVIRGGVDPKHLTQLVEAATQQMRLMSLSESANDNAAAPDDGTAEHIVMETADNGSTIVSDGTGTHAVLDPEKIGAETPVGAQAVALLVMTKDEEFLSAIKECCRGMHTVLYANSIKQASEMLAAHPIGVSIVDAALVGPNVEKLTQHLQAQKPRLVSIVAGRREEGEMLMDLINRGKVYRFLLKPASPGRVRLAVDASVKHHLDGPDSAFTKVTAKSAPAAAAPAAKPKPAPAPETPKAKAAKAAAPAPENTDVPPADIISANLTEAFDDDDSRFAQTVSGIVTGLGNSQKHETTAPPSMSVDGDADDDGPNKTLLIGGAAAAVLVAAVIGFFALSGDDEPATTVATPATVADVAPEPVREQPVREQSVREEPVREEPVVQAPVQEAPADTVEQTSLPATDAVVDEPVAETQVTEPPAVDQGQVDELIAGIESALIEGRIDDASTGVREVTQLQPDNDRLPFLEAQVNQALARKSLDDARDALRGGQYQDATNALAAAAGYGADRSSIRAIEREISDARSARETDDLLQRANARLEQGRLLNPANDNARFLFERVLASDPNNIAARQGLSAVASKLVLNAREAIDAGQLNQADSLLKSAAQIDASSNELEASWQALADARNAVSQAAADQERLEREAAAAAEKEARDAELAAIEAAKPVPVSSLTRTKYVAPKYPRSAERRGLNGWVDIVFTVTTDGKVRDIDVKNSEPGTMFVNAAIAAVERWEFEPVVENGVVVEKSAGVRLGFAIE
ncbi:MAG: TonB family protein [Pseudomonadota bacterium]